LPCIRQALHRRPPADRRIAALFHYVSRTFASFADLTSSHRAPPTAVASSPTSTGSLVDGADTALTCEAPRLRSAFRAAVVSVGDQLPGVVCLGGLFGLFGLFGRDRVAESFELAL
jgi:hypothetical protein